MANWTDEQLDWPDSPELTRKVDMDRLPEHVRQAIITRRASLAAEKAERSARRGMRLATE